MPNQKLTVEDVESILRAMRGAGYEVVKFAEGPCFGVGIGALTIQVKDIKIRIEVTKECSC